VWSAAVLSLALTALAAAAGIAALASLHGLAGHTGPAVTALLVVLGVVVLVPVVFPLQAFRSGRRRGALLAAGDLTGARTAASDGREQAHTGMGYALAVAIAAGLVAFATTNDGAIARTFLRWTFIEEAWRNVTKAFLVNVEVAIGAQVCVLVVGLLIAVMRLLPGRAGRPLRLIAICYVDVFRAIPSIIVLYLVGFGLSLAQVPVVKDLSPTWLAILALTLTYSGYVAEVYRAGIESIHPSQWSASRSLGLSYGMTLRTVIIPQAVRRIVPPLLNDFVGLQKDTALIGVMGVTDAFTQARLTASNVFNLSPVIVVAVLFVIITIPQARFVDRLLVKEQNRTGRAA
jgi:polar amino acid transport system permease protein